MNTQPHAPPPSSPSLSCTTPSRRRHQRCPDPGELRWESKVPSTRHGSPFSAPPPIPCSSPPACLSRTLQARARQGPPQSARCGAAACRGASGRPRPVLPPLIPLLAWGSCTSCLTSSTEGPAAGWAWVARCCYRRTGCRRPPRLVRRSPLRNGATPLLPVARPHRAAAAVLALVAAALPTFASGAGAAGDQGCAATCRYRITFTRCRLSITRPIPQQDARLL